MKEIDTYIIEKLHLNKDINKVVYNYHPKDRDELCSLILKLLKERGDDAYLNDIDTSKITDMSHLFKGLDPHKIDISKWNVSNVKDMYGMFYNCSNFNCDLSEWNVSNVTDIRFMFSWCKDFDSDLSKWDVSNVKDMDDMFYKCDSLKNRPSWYHG